MEAYKPDYFKPHPHLALQDENGVNNGARVRHTVFQQTIRERVASFTTKDELTFQEWYFSLD